MITVAIVNNYSGMPDSVLQAMVSAVQVQDQRDFAPAWNLPPAQFMMIPSGASSPPGAWTIHMVGLLSEPGALGYHTDEHGNPVSYVGVQTSIEAGTSASVCLSHESMEMRVDPSCQRYRSSGLKRYALEVADAVEDDRFSYVINGIQVSDFVTPFWFGRPKNGVRYDFEGHLTAPRQILPGGYQLVWDAFHGWHQVIAQNGVVQVRRHNDIWSRPGTSGRMKFRVRN